MVGSLSPLLPRFGLLPDPNGLASLGPPGLRYSPDLIPPGRRVSTQYSVSGKGTAQEGTKRALHFCIH